MKEPEERAYIDAAEVARMLEFDNATQFTSRRARLELRGFPRSVPWTERPRKWRRVDVQNWIDGTADFSAQLLDEPNPDAARRVVLMRQARQA